MLACEAMDEDGDEVLEPCSGKQPPSFVFDLVSDLVRRGVFELGLEHLSAVHELQASLRTDLEDPGHRLPAFPMRRVGKPRGHEPEAGTDDTDLCDHRHVCRVWLVPTDAEVTFADHMGRFYARRYSFPPMVGRLIGYLAVCDPPEQSIGELAEALLASRSAIAGAVKVAETLHVVRRTRVAGDRMDRVRIDLSSAQSLGMDVSEYQELAELAREGLDVLRDAPAERRAVLLEMSAFSEFLLEAMPRLQQEWQARRETLVASGDLAALPPGEARQR